MKRYLLFRSEPYCQRGGWNDFAGEFDDIQEAREEAVKSDDGDRTWWHIYDTIMCEIIEERE